jgi:AcrR family transcriptional regulator
MPRPRQFDRDEAVDRAMAVFWDRGFEAASTEELLGAMGIGRQSMYAAFGDKHGLYLAALERYQAGRAADLVARLRGADSPLSALADILLAVAREGPEERARGCLGIHAIMERAQVDPQVAALARSTALVCEAAFERVVVEAQQRGEVAPGVDARAAGRFLLATLQGLRVNATAGASPESLRTVANFAVAALRGPGLAASS